jgi:hypothetical protein
VGERKRHRVKSRAAQNQASADLADQVACEITEARPNKIDDVHEGALREPFLLVTPAASRAPLLHRRAGLKAGHR